MYKVKLRGWEEGNGGIMIYMYELHGIMQIIAIFTKIIRLSESCLLFFSLQVDSCFKTYNILIFKLMMSWQRLLQRTEER